MVCYYTWIADIRSESIHTSLKHSSTHCCVFKVKNPRLNHHLVSSLCGHCQPKKNNGSLALSQLQILPRHHCGPFLGIMRAMSTMKHQSFRNLQQMTSWPRQLIFPMLRSLTSINNYFQSNCLEVVVFSLVLVLRFSLVGRYPAISQINNPRPELHREVCRHTQTLPNTKSANHLRQHGLCMPS